MFEKIGAIALVRRPVAVRSPVETRSQSPSATALDALEQAFFAQVPGSGPCRA